jgi:hypothetical protein
LLNGAVLFETNGESFVMNDFLSAVYEHFNMDYRRFYKMDALSKLGFLASELVLGEADRELPKEDMAIILFNRSSSLEADAKFQATIQDKDNFYPSPSEFVYTLPNIVTGEIAIRNKIFGETAFYVSSDFQSEIFCNVIDQSIRFAGMNSVIAGWTEVDPFASSLNCLMTLCKQESGNDSPHPRNIPLVPDAVANIF